MLAGSVYEDRVDRTLYRRKIYEESKPPDQSDRRELSDIVRVEARNGGVSSVARYHCVLCVVCLPNAKKIRM